MVVVFHSGVLGVREAPDDGAMEEEVQPEEEQDKTPKALVASSLRQMQAGGLDIAGVVLQHVNLQRYGAIEFSDFGYLYHQVR